MFVTYLHHVLTPRPLRKTVLHFVDQVGELIVLACEVGLEEALWGQDEGSPACPCEGGACLTLPLQ